MKTKNRAFAPDLIRTFALFSVVSVHFFLNMGYYTVPMAGKRMFAMTLVRSFFMICVPLFITLSGYLMSAKKLEARYYKGLIKTVGIYLLASLVCYVFKLYVNDGEFVLREFLLETAKYNAAPYSWYVEMYLGLFLLIPFLNICYNGLETRKRKTVLIISLLSLTAFQSIFNVKNDIYPDFWLETYPITYYFIGCYLREYPVKLKRRLIFPLIIVTDIAFGAFSFFRCRDELFKWGVWQKWGSIGVVALTVLVFSFLSQCEFRKNNTKTARVISHVFAFTSRHSFGAYLVSYIFDTVFYSRLKEAVPLVTSRAEYMPIAVGFVFVGSILLSAVLGGIYSVLYKAVAFIGTSATKAPKKKPE